MNRNVLKWATLLALTVPVHVVVALAIVGVPKPPAISTQDVGRVAWGPLVEDARRMWTNRESTALVDWMPDGSGVLLQRKRWVVDARLHTITAPGANPVYLPNIPRNALVWGAPGRDHVILGWDTDGDEQYRLHRWDLDRSEPVLLTSAAERALFGAFELAGARIAYTSTRRNGTDFDIYVMDPRAAGSDRRVREMEGTWAIAGWSPIASELLLARAVSSMDSELWTLDVESGELERISGDVAGDRGVRHGSAQWSRDGRSVLYTSDRDSEFAGVRRLDLASGEETLLSEGVPWDVLSVQQTGDGATLLIAVNEDGVTRYYTTDWKGEGMQALELFSSGQFDAVLHPEAPVMLVNHVDAVGVARGYTYDLRHEELTLWAGPESRESRVPSPRLVRYPTFDRLDGEPRLISAFVYPGVGDGPRPVLIDIHGGPEAQARLRPAQTSTQQRGITLITPNVRGSTGYGRTFAHLDDQYLREDAVKDIGSLLDWIETQPDMDERRVAVVGGSYGGYMVLASLVHFSPRLRCGIDVVGVSNFVTFLENTADYRRDLRRAEYGDERDPEMRAFLESISPLNNAERITAPLMVVQGVNDPRVPVTESTQLVRRVRENGLSVGYMEAADEGHGFRKPWNSLYAGLAQRQLVRECLLR